MAKFADLPHDVVYTLFSHLTPVAFLSLSQTCRELHGLSTTAHAWKRLNIDLPLNLDNHRGKHTSIQRRELLKALRIDANWTNGSTRLRKRARIVQSRELTYFVHLLHDDLAFTLSRSAFPDRACLSAWKFGTKHPRCLGKIEPVFQGIPLLPNKISAVKHTKEEKALVAMFSTTNTDGFLQFFSLSLRREDWRPDAPYHALDLEDSVHVMTRDGLFCLVHDIQIYDSIIAASYTELSPASGSQPQYYELIILEIEHQQARSITIGSHEDMDGDKFVFKLFPDSVLIITSEKVDGVASIYDLQQILEASSPAHAPFTASPNTIQATDSMRIQYRSKFFSSHYSIFLPTEAMPYTPSDIPAIAVNNATRECHVFRLTIPKRRVQGLDTHPILVEPHAHFQMTLGTELDFVNVGPVGHRMIWIEHYPREILPNDEGVKIMKAILPAFGEEVVVSELLPGHHLPPNFDYGDCVSVWLDERRGRVCVSLLNEQIWILDL